MLGVAAPQRGCYIFLREMQLPFQPDTNSFTCTRGA